MKTTFGCFVTAILLLSAACAWAFAPLPAFTRIYPERAEFYSVAVDDSVRPARFAYLAGTSTQGMFQFYILRVDSAGSPVWTRQYGNTDRLSRMYCSSDGLAHLIGYTTQNPTLDYRLMQVSRAGGLIRNRDFGGNTSADIGRAVFTRRDGSMYVTGRTTFPDSATSDVSLLRLTALGQIEWARSFSGTAEGVALAVAGDTTLFIYGVTDSSDAQRGRDFFVMRTDSLGQQPVLRRFAGPAEEICSDAVRISRNLTVLVGSRRPYGSGTTWDMLVLATNDNGDSLWSRQLGGPGDDMALGVAATFDLDSGIVIAGWSADAAGQMRRGRLIKLNRQGDSLWSLLASDTLESELAAVVQDSLYRYHAAGHIHTDVNHGFYLVTEPDPRSPGGHPPQGFSLLAPVDRDTIRQTATPLQWSRALDPDAGDTVRYRILIDTDTTFASPTLIGLLDSTRHLWPLDTDDVVLYWRVIAQDRAGNTRICRERHWRFLCAVPDSTAPFNLAAPDSGAWLPAPAATFRWYKAYDPDPVDSITYALRFMVNDTGFGFTGLRDTFITVSFANHPVIEIGDTVTWYVTARSYYPAMTRESTQRWRFVNFPSGLEELPEAPLEFALQPPYPNPFNATVTIGYSVDRMETVKLDVFNIAGQWIATLADGLHTPGAYRSTWNGSTITGTATSGMYFARLSADSRQRTVKLMLIR